MKYISRGAPAKGSPHKGSWGDRYIIENPNQSKRMSCSKCVHYMDDKSCSAKSVYIPDIGYDYWKYCKSFALSPEFGAYSLEIRTSQKAVKTSSEVLTNRQAGVNKNNQVIKPSDSKLRIFVSTNANRCNTCNQKCTRMLKEYIKADGKHKKISVAVCLSCNRNYINQNHYENFIEVNKNTNINFIYATPKTRFLST